MKISSKEFPNSNFEWINKINVVTSRIPGQWRFVGGCVRDSLLGIHVTDIDITTLSTPDEIEESMRGFTVTTIGKKFGTIGVFYKGFSIEITTTRQDVKTYGRKADVSFDSVSFEEDSNRRDFTINGLMLSGNEIYDYHNGLNHLKNGVVEFIGSANERIEEDYLRLLRYIRFFVRFNVNGKFNMNLVQKYVHHISFLSKERVIKEIESMCSKPNTEYAFQLLNESGISKVFWNNDMFCEIDDNLTKDEKFAYGIWNFYDLTNKFPLNKSVKYLISLRKPNVIDIYVHLAFLWNKHKTVKAMHDYLKIHEYFYHENVEINCDLNTGYFDKFDGINRGKVEFLARYYCLINKEYNYEILLKNKELLNDVKKQYN